MTYKDIKGRFDLINTVVDNNDMDYLSTSFLRFIAKISSSNLVKDNFAIVYFEKRTRGKSVLSIILRDTKEYAILTNRKDNTIACEEINSVRVGKIINVLSKDIIDVFDGILSEFDGSFPITFIADLETGKILSKHSVDALNMRKEGKVF